MNNVVIECAVDGCEHSGEVADFLVGGFVERGGYAQCTCHDHLAVRAAFRCDQGRTPGLAVVSTAQAELLAALDAEAAAIAALAHAELIRQQANDDHAEAFVARQQANDATNAALRNVLGTSR